MSADPPTDQLVLQRVRNRIIEHLEMAASFEEQQQYQSNAPIAEVPAELICQWEDIVDRARLEEYCPPVFSDEELQAIAEFQTVWEFVVQLLPRQLPSILEAQKLPEWKRLRDGAELALKAFDARGRLPEDKDI